jgi:hypothetical protein
LRRENATGALRAEAAGWTSAKKPNALPASTSGTHAALEALKKSLLHQAGRISVSCIA